MANRKRLPLFFPNSKYSKGPTVSLVERLLIVVAVYVFVVTGVLLAKTNMLTSYVSPTVFGIVALWIVVPVGVSYLYWHPRYKAF